MKGLQGFLDRCCPQACVPVDLKEMAGRHVTQRPTLVVDGMACLNHWYSCEDWLCGGQWKEYMNVLKRWVEAFTVAGIRLVFFFDGVVNEQKRQVWVKRRHRVNGEISKIFRYVKSHGRQPGRHLSCLPSGLASFTSFALRSLGQEVYLSVQEADYEIASYARQHGSIGILGQDSDFIIYDSAPYLSVAKLRIDTLTTVLYDRQKLCQSIRLATAQLPLLACLLGNDVVSEGEMQHIRDEAMAKYREKAQAPLSDAYQGQTVLAVSHLLSSMWTSDMEDTDLIPKSLNVSASQRRILKAGICSYLLPGHEALQGGDISAPSCVPAFEKCVSAEILKACKEQHIAVEGYMVYCVLWEGMAECSNTLEDADDAELLPQALVFKPCRKHVYGLLLLNGHDGSSIDPPAVREWFVYPGNPLKEADMVEPVPVCLPSTCEKPSLDLLWFGRGPEVPALRLTSFLSIFDCHDFSSLYGNIEDSMLTALCLVTYIALQIKTLSLEDLDAYLSQAVCLRLKSPQELQQIKLPSLCSRAVQLGSLYVRGLCHLLGANCASGRPLPSAALMPWHSFDGRLFHSKYLLAHSSVDNTALLEGDASCLSLFLCLRKNLVEACRTRGRVLQSRPDPPGRRTAAEFSDRETHADVHENWRERRTQTVDHQQGRGWRERPWERGGHRGGRGTAGDRHFDHQSQSFDNFGGGGPPNTSRPSRHPGHRSRPNRGRYHLAPRWSKPPAPGT